MKFPGLSTTLRSRVLASSLVATLAAGAHATPLEVQVRGNGSCAGVEAVVEVRGTDLDRERPVPLDDGTGWGTVEVAPRHFPLVVSARAEGCWAAPVPLEAPSDGPLDLELWPAANVSGRVRVAGGTGKELPGRLELLLEAVPGADTTLQPERAVLECGIQGEHLPPCPAPAGRWALRVEAAGWVPWYLWDLRLPPGETAPLGTIEFRRGASIVGRVVTEEGRPAPAAVSVTPLVDRSQAGDDGLGLPGRMGHRAEAGPWGWFQLAGVAPGRYAVRAEHPGYAPAVLTAAVEEGREVVLPDPLVLRRPVRLEVEVTPGTTAGGEPWTVALWSLPDLGPGERLGEGTTREGRWISPHLPEGWYRLEVHGPGGELLAARRVSLGDDLQLERVPLDLLVVRGTVRLGERDLAARLLFGGETGDERIEAVADPEEGFSVTLPRAGQWRVHVTSEDPPVDRPDVTVEVEAGPDGRAEDLVIELPDTTLEGEVVDETLQPVAGAAVRVVRLEPFTQLAARSDAGGWFERRGLRPGRYEVEATAGGLRSDTVRVALEEGTPPPPLQLVLRKVVRLHGRITAGGRPVPGARILAYPLGAGGRLVGVSAPMGSSGPDGTFDLELPGATTAARLAVLAPGFVLSLVPVDLRGRAGAGEPLEIAVRQGGGTLLLEHGEGAGSNFAVVYLGGHPVDAPLLAAWAAMNGMPARREEVLEVPAVPGGEYVACRVTPREGLLVLGGAAVPRSDRCTTGLLAEGSRLVLRLP